MPMLPRCLDCRRRFNGRPSDARCPSCKARHKALRNAEAVRSPALVDRSSVCVICGKPPTPGDPLTADHVVPLSRGRFGGPMRAAHRSCNSARRDRG